MKKEFEDSVLGLNKPVIEVKKESFADALSNPSNKRGSYFSPKELNNTTQGDFFKQRHQSRLRLQTNNDDLMGSRVLSPLSADKATSSLPSFAKAHGSTLKDILKVNNLIKEALIHEHKHDTNMSILDHSHLLSADSHASFMNGGPNEWQNVETVQNQSDLRGYALQSSNTFSLLQQRVGPTPSGDEITSQLDYIKKEKLTRDMITPEIAAFVVKEYLLPMFESDGKQLLAKKNQSKRSK